jgi:hypothetical protein
MIRSLLRNVGLSTLLLTLIIIGACGRKGTPATPEQIIRGVEADFQDISVRLYRYANDHKRFPPTLQVLEQPINIIDWPSANTNCPREYGYAVSSDGQTAVLVSVGIDGQPGTPDDKIKVMELRVPTDAEREARSKLLLGNIYSNWPCTSIKKEEPR